MNKYILADMATERLTRDIGLVARLLPEEIKTLEKATLVGKMGFLIVETILKG